MARKRQLELPEALERFQQASLLAMLAGRLPGCCVFGRTRHRGGWLSAQALWSPRLLHLSGVIRISIPARWVNAAAVLYLLFLPADYFFFSRDLTRATVHMVIFVAASKLLTASTSRDSVLLGVIAFLEILAASVLSTNLTFLILLLPFLGRVFGRARELGNPPLHARPRNRAVGLAHYRPASCAC